MTLKVARPVRCPACPTGARLLGIARVPSDHASCTATIEIKCGKCGALVIVALDPTKQPGI
jgi:DNA-directed RNA polymerase subunit RPC12/RpoP